MNEFAVTTPKPKDVPRPLAKRSAIDPFIVMDVMGEANARELEGHDIIHMEVGQPATPAPRAARERAQQALESERLGYTEALGLPKLRERIARHLSERYGVGVTPERVVVTAGSSAGFVLAFLPLLDKDDSLGLPSPGYPCYRQILKALDVRPALIETSGQGRWMPTVADVERLAGEGAAGLLLASPNNPTGSMALSRRLAEIAEACRRHRLWLISDEIYHGLEYEAEAETALAHSDEAIVVNSFSKYFSMTGWRIGWLVVPEALVRPIERLSQNLYISPPAISQVAALGAFDGIEELEAIKSGYATAPCCSKSCHARGCHPSCPPTEPSTSMPMSADSPPTAKLSPRPCSRTLASPSHLASILIPIAAGATSASVTPVLKLACARRRATSTAG